MADKVLDEIMRVNQFFAVAINDRNETLFNPFIESLV